MPSVTASTSVSRGRGRPREFDIAEALDGAIRVFRERGYHATSVADLKEATALASGSIYKAFKGKREVFLAAFDRYVSEREEQRRFALHGKLTGKEKLGEFLRLYAESSAGIQGRRGCLVAGSAMELATFDDEIARRVKAALARNEALLSEIIRTGQTDGSILNDIDHEAVARLMLCVMQGMRVVGKTGRTRDEMVALVDLAMRVVA